MLEVEVKNQTMEVIAGFNVIDVNKHANIIVHQLEGGFQKKVRHCKM